MKKSTLKKTQQMRRKFARMESDELTRERESGVLTRRLEMFKAGFRHAAGRDPTAEELPSEDSMFRLYGAWAAGWSRGIPRDNNGVGLDRLSQSAMHGGRDI